MIFERTNSLYLTELTTARKLECLTSIGMQVMSMLLHTVACVHIALKSLADIVKQINTALCRDSWHKLFEF